MQPISVLKLFLLYYVVQVCIPTPEEKLSTLIVTPFLLLFGSVLATITYYAWFHPGSILKNNGPKFSPEDNEGALCACSTLFCCQMQDCMFPKICYQKMTPSSTRSLHSNQNGYHIEMVEDTYVNENACPRENSNIV